MAKEESATLKYGACSSMTVFLLDSHGKGASVHCGDVIAIRISDRCA